MKYTQVPQDTFKTLVLNAGIICESFTPTSGEVTGIMGATTGGITFESNPEYEDYGDGMDNVPANTKELKRLVSCDPVLSGTFLTVTAANVAKLIGAADVSSTKITPRMELKDADFDDVWFVGDYSDKNTGDSAGFIAIHVKNALNTAGFSLKSTDKGKGEMAFELHGHYSISNIDDVPFEVYVKSGSAA